MRSDSFRLQRGILCIALSVAALVRLTGVSIAADDVSAILDSATKLRQEGNFRLAVDLLEAERVRAGASCSPRVIGELGVAYLQANRLVEAEETLKEAYEKAGDETQAALWANDLGNLSARRGRKDEAIRYFEQARAKGEATTALSAGLNLARLATVQNRGAQLVVLRAEVMSVQDTRERVRYLLNLGSQARTLGASYSKLAFESLDAAREGAEKVGDHWLLAESLDNLSQLYEDRGRVPEALRLADGAVAQLQSEDAHDLMIGLQWRRGRLLRAQGRNDLALTAYQSAVNHLEAVRQDIPIEYLDGRSSFRETLEPIYLGLAELLLQQADGASSEGRLQLFRRARDVVELIKQTELQDYLGERCLVESARPLRDAKLPPKTAVLYPVIFEKRLVLMVETQIGIEVRGTQIQSDAIREKALLFARSVRDATDEYLGLAQDLYKLLLKPVEEILSRQNIDTLIVVPDGPLRLIPMGALHDGKTYVIEKFAIAIAPGLTISSIATPNKAVGKVLFAGLSQPGPVVTKLPQGSLTEFAQDRVRRGTRTVDYAEKLALPGVAEEIESLMSKIRGDRLLNSEFTVSRFRDQVGSQDYRIIHIASHAVFTKRPGGSFILAYDDLLTMDQLEVLLRAKSQQATQVELLSLSACQTAEGDDRAPLGIAGAALKAHAGSALGSLWPVDDEATKALMLNFYDSLTKLGSSKAKALQQAQLTLLRTSSLNHPFFWAPFILVGSGQ